MKHFKYLKTVYKKMSKNPNALVEQAKKNALSMSLSRVNAFLLNSSFCSILFFLSSYIQSHSFQKSESRQDMLMDLGVLPSYVETFSNRYCNSDDEVEIDSSHHNTEVRFSMKPYWRSEDASAYVDWIERHREESELRRITGIGNRPQNGSRPRPRSRRDPPVIDTSAVAPAGLPEDWYRLDFLVNLPFAKLLELDIQPPMFPLSGNFNDIIPKRPADVIIYKDRSPVLPPGMTAFPQVLLGKPTFDAEDFYRQHHHSTGPVPGPSGAGTSNSAAQSTSVPENPAEESELMDHDALFSGSDDNTEPDDL
jgi:hypothetical protein